MNCRVFYHDKCFDGACSASLFTRFHRECFGTATSFDYRGLVHKAGVSFDPAWMDASGENAIVDFKYSPSPLLTWWFDHHESAFETPAYEAQFLAQQADGSYANRHFIDTTAPSCTGMIARIANARFGMDIAPLAELIHWADIVDGAKYESAQSAVELAAPAMKLTLIIESAPDSAAVQQFIPMLAYKPLGEVLAESFVQQALAPLLERHAADIELIRQRSHCTRGVIDFDIIDHPSEGYNKFIPYYLHPEATYNVSLSKSSFRTKISVGTNPWTKLPATELANIAAICQRYGGGGHARVGAISFPLDGEADARAAAQEIITELRSRSS